jgi:hypothetical protein
MRSYIMNRPVEFSGNAAQWGGIGLGAATAQAKESAHDQPNESA